MVYVKFKGSSDSQLPIGGSGSVLKRTRKFQAVKIILGKDV